ncbi:hypothetical protein CEXT_788021 [Caerostris extrusa]|uniref:Uncharacterized protein n=1 Tax=Caerostris extrusa TaxID=172846 RepID=A0AAV4NLZ5_CAEEX|nr:hypothetical protein CEXT_788021 [Caerostris extrusa]
MLVHWSLFRCNSERWLRCSVLLIESMPILGNPGFHQRDTPRDIDGMLVHWSLFRRNSERWLMCSLLLIESMPIPENPGFHQRDTPETQEEKL